MNEQEVTHNDLLAPKPSFHPLESHDVSEPLNNQLVDSREQRDTATIETPTIASGFFSVPAAPLVDDTPLSLESVDTAKRLVAPFPLPTLPSVAFPPGLPVAPVQSEEFTVHASGDHQTEGHETPDSQQSIEAFHAPVAAVWEPLTNAVSPDVAQVMAFPAAATFTAAPAFQPTPSLSSIPSPPSIPSLSSLPSLPLASELPSLSDEAAFTEIPAFPIPSSAEMPSVLAFPSEATPFDAGASFDSVHGNPQSPGFSSLSPFDTQLDLSTNPLPIPEALVVRGVEESTKKSRFGRKKSEAIPEITEVGSFSPPLLPTAPVGVGAKKTKRFGKKHVQTVDLLGAPLTSTASALDVARPSGLGADFTAVAGDETKETKGKRKLFAKVDRSKEPTLTPSTARSRKTIQGLAALSLLAGAGLFAVSLLDKKSPAPTTPQVTIPVDSPIAIDPTASSAPPATVETPPVDPVTGLPVPGLDDDPQSPIADPALDPLPTDAVAVSTEPITDQESPVSTIAPGPDDLEFSSGGDFSVE
jgi:hypothetical protein